MTGIQSDVDEVSVVYLDSYQQKRGQALFSFKILFAMTRNAVMTLSVFVFFLFFVLFIFFLLSAKLNSLCMRYVYCGNNDRR